MNEKTMERLCAADAATQRRAAEAIRRYPDTPIYDTTEPVRVDASSWAYTYVESQKHADMAVYLGALAWFYTETRPTDALRFLIHAKVNVIKHGGPTDLFWKMLETIHETYV